MTRAHEASLRVYVLVAVLGAPCAMAAPIESGGTIVEIRVRGNQILSDDEVRAMAAVAVGDRLDAGEIADIERRLDTSGRFVSVDVRPRFLSLTDTDEIALIIVVREGIVPEADGPVSRALGTIRRSMMVLPLLDYTEGYGVALGARTSFVELFGPGSRVSVPATLGGTTQVGLTFALQPTAGPIERILGGVGWRRQENPGFDTNDERTRLWGRGERRVSRLHLAMEAERAGVRFGAIDDTLTRFRAVVGLDTRRAPVFPRNAVLLRASYEWLHTSTEARVIGRPGLRVELYRGLLGQSVLAVRADYLGADAPLPAYEQPLLGGGASLRGWPVGALVGDRRLDGSVEVRVPLRSPLAATRVGAAAFYDTGTVYDAETALDRARFRHGVGVGLLVDVPLLYLRVDAAHNLTDGVRVHVAVTVGF